MVFRYSSAPALTAARSPAAYSLSQAIQSDQASLVQSMARASRMSTPSVRPIIARHQSMSCMYSSCSGVHDASRQSGRLSWQSRTI